MESTASPPSEPSLAGMLTANRVALYVGIWSPYQIQAANVKVLERDTEGLKTQVCETAFWSASATAAKGSPLGLPGLSWMNTDPPM